MIVKVLAESFAIMLGLFWRKNREIWVFGAWHGEQFSDSSKYFFKYVNEHKDALGIRPIWITKDKSLYNKILSEGFEVYTKSSVYGWYYSLTAGVAFFTHRINDINYRGLFLGANLIQLWHGMPLKKINLDLNVNQGLLPKIKRFAQKLEFKNYSMILATSEATKATLSSAFGTNKVKVTGLPRNDLFIKADNKPYSNDQFVITFMPTFRESAEKAYLYFLKEEKIEDFYNFLNEINSKIYLKLHSLDANSINIPENYRDKIVVPSNKIDTQELLLETDLLITDYSSCYIDFLILNRPIIFSIPDYETYKNTERNFYYEYNEITPGKKVKNYEELSEAILTYYKSREVDESDRIRVGKYFNALDQNVLYSERLIEELKIDNIFIKVGGEN